MSLLPLLTAVVLGTTPLAAQEQAPADARNGQVVGNRLCRACHLISRDDRGPVPDGVPSFMAMAAEDGMTAELLKARLLGEHPVMPPPPLTTQQASDVVAYILSLRH